MCESRFPCPLCSFPCFESAEKLRSTLINAATELLKCPICGEALMGLDKLTIHLFSHARGDDNMEKAPDVKKKRARSSANKPAKKSVSNVKPVRICPKLPMFPISALPVYETIPIIANAVVYNCSVCGIVFPNDNILEMHKSLIHTNHTSEKSHQFPCHLCSKAFNMKGSLMVHLRVAHFGARQNKRDKTNKSGEEVTAEQNSKQWSCDVCHKSFTTKYFLKKHNRLHTGETPYACAQCGKTFTFQQSYHKHLLYHSTDKPHACVHCGRTFKELSTLHNHERIHTGEKPFTCESCGKTFRQRVSYLVHKRIHTGVMPYKCTACDKKFRYKVSQRTHKCPAQPPGTVVRQSGDLVEKLMKKNIDEPKNDNGVKIKHAVAAGPPPPNSKSIDLIATTKINNNISFGDELVDSSLVDWNLDEINRDLNLDFNILENLPSSGERKSEGGEDTAFDCESLIKALDGFNK